MGNRRMFSKTVVQSVKFLNMSEAAQALYATPTQARRVHAYYIAGIKQPEISRIEGVHSSKVSVAIRRGLRNMRRCYDGLFQTE